MVQCLFSQRSPYLRFIAARVSSAFFSEEMRGFWPPPFRFFSVRLLLSLSPFRSSSVRLHSLPFPIDFALLPILKDTCVTDFRSEKRR